VVAPSFFRNHSRPYPSTSNPLIRKKLRNCKKVRKTGRFLLSAPGFLCYQWVTISLWGFLTV
jgi:hypothetical protein